MTWANRVRQLMAAMWFVGCASAPPPTAAGIRREDPALARVRALAPDLAARSDRAERDARAEKTPSLRRDLHRRAGLLAEAAKAEADRVEIERQVSAVERRIAVAIDRRAAAERAELVAERDVALQQNAADDQRDLERVFAGAPVDPNRADEVLRRRASARLAAAIALGADGDAVEQASQQLAAAARADERGTRGHLAVASGDRGRLAVASGDRGRLAVASGDRGRLALAAADRALGVARGHADAPTRDQTRDLVARARERGLVASASSSGTRLELTDAFARGELAVRVNARPRIELVRDMLLAFPHGSIRIAVQASGSSDAELALAQRRAARLVEQLGRTIDRVRVVADPATSFGDSADLSLTLPAYVDLEERAVGLR